MNALEINEALNDIKDRFPNDADIALVEGVQTLFNKEVSVITDHTRRALKSFPMQFTKRIPTENGEWTTQLHIWANCQVPELLEIDPVMLTARNSDGETVLMCLLMAATGRFTQQINYDLIQKILDANMQFQYLTEPNDETSVESGNVWDEEDLDHKTALDFLAEFATGTGVFDGSGGDDRVKQMLEEFADRPEVDEGPGEPLSDQDFDEEAEKEAIINSSVELDASLETTPDDIPTIDNIAQETVGDGNHQPTTLNNGNISLNNPDAAPIAGSKHLIEALVALGKSSIQF